MKGMLDPCIFGSARQALAVESQGSVKRSDRGCLGKINRSYFSVASQYANTRNTDYLIGRVLRCSYGYITRIELRMLDSFSNN